VVGFPSQDDILIRRITVYERISAILWIGIGIIQILLVHTIIAGIWNVFAGISRISMAKQIKKRNNKVPEAFEGISLVIGFINLLSAAVIGILFVGFCFFVKQKGSIDPIQRQVDSFAGRVNEPIKPNSEEPSQESPDERIARESQSREYYDRLEQLAQERLRRSSWQR